MGGGVAVVEGGRTVKSDVPFLCFFSVPTSNI